MIDTNIGSAPCIEVLKCQGNDSVYPWAPFSFFRNGEKKLNSLYNTVLCVAGVGIIVLSFPLLRQFCWVLVHFLCSCVGFELLCFLCVAVIVFPVCFWYTCVSLSFNHIILFFFLTLILLLSFP